MMSRILLLTALALVVSMCVTDAFVVSDRSAAVAHKSATKNVFDVKPSFATTSTQLHLKVDPNSIKNKNKNSMGVAKGAAYGGSIAVAVLLPVVFLAWAAFH
jgi:hypothetical protein